MTPEQAESLRQSNELLKESIIAAQKWKDTYAKYRREAEDKEYKLLAEIDEYRAMLERCRDAINSLPEESLGTGCNPEGLMWALRDEMVDDITKVLADT